MDSIRRSFEYPVQIGFYTFCRYFVPGVYAAFWIVIYAIRLVHREDIDMVSVLLGYLHANSSTLLPLILAFGAFVGFVLVGIDPYVMLIFSTRPAYAINRYLLSSQFFRWPCFYFMDFRSMRLHFQRISLDVIEEQGREELKQIAKKGGYEEKCLLREMLANFFWSNAPADAKAHLTERREMSSMFISMAFVTVFLSILQFVFYLNHLYYDGADWPDLLILGPLCYVVFNLIANAMAPSKKRGEKSSFQKSHFLLGLLLIGSLALTLYFNIFAIIPWFSVGDPLLLLLFPALYCVLYWGGTFRFCHYVLNYERHVVMMSKEIVQYANLNYTTIQKTMEKFIPERGRRNIISLVSILLAVGLVVSVTLKILWPLIRVYIWEFQELIQLLHIKEWILILILAIILMVLISMSVIIKRFSAARTKSRGCIT